MYIYICTFIYILYIYIYIYKALEKILLVPLSAILLEH